MKKLPLIAASGCAASNQLRSPRLIGRVGHPQAHAGQVEPHDHQRYRRLLALSDA
ncbi:MAG: hypothetical protein U0Z44_21860 [Kouleothrix sp.]